MKSFALIPQAYAAGTTSTTSEPGQVQLQQDGDVLYLNSQTNGNSLTKTYRPTFSSIFRSPISGTSELTLPFSSLQPSEISIASQKNFIIIIAVLAVFAASLELGTRKVGATTGKSTTNKSSGPQMFGIILLAFALVIVGTLIYFASINTFQSITTL